ncbi:hypothetical protein F7725_008284, partial [Dissostichus mawsoni]
MKRLQSLNLLHACLLQCTCFDHDECSVTFHHNKPSGQTSPTEGKNYNFTTLCQSLYLSLCLTNYAVTKVFNKHVIIAFAVIALSITEMHAFGKTNRSCDRNQSNKNPNT